MRHPILQHDGEQESGGLLELCCSPHNRADPKITYVTAHTPAATHTAPSLQLSAMESKRELEQAEGRLRWLNSSRPAMTRLLVPM